MFDYHRPPDLRQFIWPITCSLLFHLLLVAGLAAEWENQPDVVWASLQTTAPMQDDASATELAQEKEPDSATPDAVETSPSEDSDAEQSDVEEAPDAPDVSDAADEPDPPDADDTFQYTEPPVARHSKAKTKNVPAPEAPAAKPVQVKAAPVAKAPPTPVAAPAAAPLFQAASVRPLGYSTASLPVTHWQQVAAAAPIPQPTPQPAPAPVKPATPERAVPKPAVVAPPTPVLAPIKPVPPAPAAVVAKPKPVTPPPAPVAAKAKPVAHAPAPVVAKTKPVVPAAAPVAARPKPVVPAAPPVVAQPKPVPQTPPVMRRAVEQAKAAPKEQHEIHPAVAATVVPRQNPATTEPKSVMKPTPAAVRAPAPVAAVRPPAPATRIQVADNSPDKLREAGKMLLTGQQLAAVRPAAALAPVKPPAQPEKKGTLAPPQTPVSLFEVPVKGDLEIELSGKEVAANGIKVRVLFRSFPRARHKKAMTLAENKKSMILSPKASRTAVSTVQSVIENASDGIYEFRSVLGAAQSQEVNITLTINGKSSNRIVKRLGAKKVGGDSYIFKVLMPEGVLWDDEANFSGSIEDSDGVTKYNSDSGLVWKEYN